MEKCFKCKTEISPKRLKTHKGKFYHAKCLFKYLHYLANKDRIEGINKRRRAAIKNTLSGGRFSPK